MLFVLVSIQQSVQLLSSIILIQARRSFTIILFRTESHCMFINTISNSSSSCFMLSRWIPAPSLLNSSRTLFNHRRQLSVTLLVKHKAHIHSSLLFSIPLLIRQNALLDSSIFRGKRAFLAESTHNISSTGSLIPFINSHKSTHYEKKR